MYAHDALIWSPNVIEHHGILKQKWGVRHGPPYPLDESDKTQAQKKAAASDKKNDSKSSGSSSESSSSSSSSSKKSVKDMTDDELNKAVNRARLEKTYKELTTDDTAKKSVSTGKKILSGLGEIGGEITKRTLTDLGTQTASYVLGTEINKVLEKYNKGSDSSSIDPKNVQNRSKKK